MRKITTALVAVCLAAIGCESKPPAPAKNAPVMDPAAAAAHAAAMKEHQPEKKDEAAPADAKKEEATEEKKDEAAPEAKKEEAAPEEKKDEAK